MSRKVMLNQGVHYQSQVMPFAYALNISLKDIDDQVHEFRNAFV